MRHDIAPSPQDRTAQWFFRVRQPCASAVGLISRIGRGDAVGRAMQNDRPARPTCPGQEDEGVEADAIAHRYHGLESACADTIINDPHRPHLAVAFRRVNMTATLVITL